MFMSIFSYSLQMFLQLHLVNWPNKKKPVSYHLILVKTNFSFVCQN